MVKLRQTKFEESLEESLVGFDLRQTEGLILKSIKLCVF